MLRRKNEINCVNKFSECYYLLQTKTDIFAGTNRKSRYADQYGISRESTQKNVFQIYEFGDEAMEHSHNRIEFIQKRC